MKASLSPIYPSKVTTSGTTIIKSIVLRVTTLVENSTSPSPWLARIGRTARAGVADCTIKVLNSAVGKFFAVNIRIANITAGPNMNLPIRAMIVSLSNLIVFSPALASTIPM